MRTPDIPPSYTLFERSPDMEKHLKVLKERGNRGRKINKGNYPWAEMGIGQSFVEYSTKIESVRTAARNYGKKTGKCFICLQHEGYVEVTRVDPKEIEPRELPLYDPVIANSPPPIPTKPWPEPPVDKPTTPVTNGGWAEREKSNGY